MTSGRLRNFVRGRLWRHLFLWFGMTILASVITTSAVSMATHRFSDPPHHRFSEGMQILAYQVGQAWENPNNLHSLLEQAYRANQTGLILRDAEHNVIDSVGECHRGPPPDQDSFLREIERQTPGGGRPILPHLLGRRGPPPMPFAGEHILMIVLHDKPVGWLSVCSMPMPPMPPTWRLAFPLVVLVIMLGAAAYRVALGLTRPLNDLVQVTRRIGAGELTSRASLDNRPPDEVSQLALSINEMAAKIEKQIRDQRTLLAMVSHELRTPLARMRLLVEIAKDASETRRSLVEIEAEVISIDNIVGAMLANARLEFAIVNRQAADAKELLQRALVQCDPAPPLDAPGDSLWPITGDLTLLTRALANIVDNANKYGRGVAAARLRRVGEHVHFEVIDRGEGFTVDTVKVFEPFVRTAEVLDPTSMGLGLNLVKRVAEAHEGTAYCENLKGGGACVGFSVKLVPLPQKGTPMPNSKTGKGPNA